MWGSVLGLAFLAGLNLVRIGLTLLVISRPRPVRNVLAFGAGCLTGAIPVVVIPLILLNLTGVFTSFTQGATIPATNSVVRHLQAGVGVVALTLAVVITVRGLKRRRRQAQLLSQPGGQARQERPGMDGTISTLTSDSSGPSANSSLLSRAPEAPSEHTTAFRRMMHRAQDVPAEGASTFRRLLHRAHNAWENGSLWVAYAVGLTFGGPPPGEGLFLFAIIATSGATVGMQVAAAAVYLVGMLAVIELVLVGYLAAPARAHAVLNRLNDWTMAHRQRVLVAIFAIVGSALLATGLGAI